MELRSFSDFVKERDLIEAHHANKEAMNFDVKMRTFLNRFPEGEGERIVQAAGFKNVRDFLHHPNEKEKYSWLRTPGQDNYVHKPIDPHRNYKPRDDEDFEQDYFDDDEDRMRKEKKGLPQGGDNGML